MNYESTSQFIQLEMPRRLWVPCALTPPFEAMRPRPAGTTVAQGETLIESGVTSDPVPLAPAAGQIGETGQAVLTNLAQVPVVSLETDPKAEPFPATAGPISIEAIRETLSGLGPSQLGETIDRLRAAGVWADRWTSPDLLDQLHSSLKRPADTILCTMLDADRGLSVNRACAMEFAAEIVAAVAALARVTGAGRAWLIVDVGEDAETWAAVQQVAAQAAGDLRLVPIDNDYPQLDPTLLLYMLTGRRLRHGRLPTDQGVLILDAAAAVAVGRALVVGEPMLKVPLAVYDRTAVDGNDDQPGTTRLVLTPVGTPLFDVLEELDAGHGPGRRGPDLWAGGPLRERRLSPDCIIAGGELGIFIAPREPAVNPDPCIRCGWCVEGCPVRAHPAALLDAAQRDDLSHAHAYGLDACIECGICSYVCPSHLPLLQGIRTLR